MLELRARCRLMLANSLKRMSPKHRMKPAIRVAFAISLLASVTCFPTLITPKHEKVLAASGLLKRDRNKKLSADLREKLNSNPGSGKVSVILKLNQRPTGLL